MAWTLVAALCILAFVIVAQFGKTFRLFQLKSSVYPSAADIDQILPPEILEAILSKADINTLLSCSSVSKYWHYHAKDQVFATVLDREKVPRATLAEIAEDVNDPNLHINWLAYNEHYKPAWHIQDGRYFQGKKLIDARFKSVWDVSRAMKSLYAMNGDSPSNKYVVRTRLIHAYDSGENSYFHPTDSNEFIAITTLPDRVKKNLQTGMEVEIVEDLSNILRFSSSLISLKSPAHVRIIENRNFFGGVPIDRSLLMVIFLIFMPCLVKDFWSASADLKYYVHVVFASTGLLGLFLLSAIYAHEGVELARPVHRSWAKKYYWLGIFALISISAIFYRHALAIGFFFGMEAGLGIYGLFTFVIYEIKHPMAKQIISLLCCILVSIIDWKLTADAARNGAIWYSLLYNLTVHVGLWIWIALLCLFNEGSLAGRIILSVDRRINIIFSLGLLSVLWITCATPYTTVKFPL